MSIEHTELPICTETELADLPFLKPKLVVKSNVGIVIKVWAYSDVPRDLILNELNRAAVTFAAREHEETC